MILTFGKSGQVATELQLQADVLGDILALGSADCDLMQPGAARAAIRAHRPAVVINAAAYTAVDKAETDREAAYQLNEHAVADMAQTCAEMGIPLVHISTDYVFPGGGDAPWHPGDGLGPLGVYGASKLAGEAAIRAAGGVHVILRTSWVFSAHGNNFVKTMRRLGAERDNLTIVADQIGGPTPADAIAAACLTIADQLHAAPGKSGTYHFSGAPDCSWADFAREIFAQSGLGCQVEDIPTSAYPTPAARPLNSRMDCSATEGAFGVKRPDWRDGLARVLKDGAGQR